MCACPADKTLLNPAAFNVRSPISSPENVSQKFHHVIVLTASLTSMIIPPVCYVVPSTMEQ